MDAVPAALRILVVVLAVAAASPAMASAATIGVTTELDVVANDGACSLREAISAANADARSGAAAGECVAGSGADTVAVPAGSYVIRIDHPFEETDINQAGDFGIKSAVTIRGAGPTETTIHGGGIDRVFFVKVGATAVFSDLTISGGRTHSGCSCMGAEHGADGTGAGAGGSVTQGDAGGTAGGGGILNEGTATIRDAVVTDNSTGDGADVGAPGTAGKGGPAGGAGGDYTGGDGGSSGPGGGVLNLGTLMVERTTLRANWTGDGGDASDQVRGGDGGSNPSGSGGAGGDAHGGAGGDAGGGGAIASIGSGTSVTIVDSRIAGNATGTGGRGGAADGGTGGDAHVTCSGCSANGGAGGDAIAGDGGDGGDGGGVLATGAATVTGTTVTNNRTGGAGQGRLGQGGWSAAGVGPTGQGGTSGTGRGGQGGSGGDGAGIAATGTLVVEQATIDHNVAADGNSGGFANAGGSSAGHIATGTGGDGGAGGTGGLSASGQAALTNVTFAYNKGGAGIIGGGATGTAISPSGDGGNGGSGGAAVEAGATFRHVTVVGNTGGAGGEARNATAGAAGAAGQPGAIGAGGIGGPASLRNSIVSANGAPSCTGPPTDGGHNIAFPDTTCPGAHVDPLLGPLADNGGPTWTMSLASGSPAVDLVPSAGAGCAATDQRGVTRPQGPGCDAGAYELAPTPGGGDGNGGGDGSGGGDGNGDGDGDGGSPPPGDTQAPVLSGVRMTNSVFTRHPGATAFVYRLSEPAKVTISIRRAVPGRRKGDRCVKATKRLRRAKPCTRNLFVGSFTRSSPAGATSVPFDGRIGSKRLAPGRYRVTIVATDAAGNASPPVTVWFRIVRG